MGFLSLFLIQFVPFVVVRSSAEIRKQQQQKRHPDEDGKDAAGHHAIGGGRDTVRVNK